MRPNIFRNPFIHNRIHQWKISQGYKQLAKEKLSGESGETHKRIYNNIEDNINDFLDYHAEDILREP
jgi:hypothetical protein